MIILKYGNMGVWKYGNRATWKYGNMEINLMISFTHHSKKYQNL